MASNDPKHGRWILPLIIGGMVLLTYTFVNSLEPASDPEGSSTTEEPPFPTTPTSSTSTVPAEFAAFMVTLDVFESQVLSFDDQVQRINDDWDARNTSFRDTRAAFNELKETVGLWEDEVADTASEVPAALAEPHVQLVLTAGELEPAVEDIVLGLEAPDDGTLRRTAVAQFSDKVQAVVDAIDTIRDTAEAASSTPAVPDDEGEEGGGETDTTAEA